MVTPQPLELLAPLSGVLMPLDMVPDPLFSSRVIGDGLCIDPTCSTLCAPLAGIVSNVQAGGHAISITDENGVQVLLHIGLDTVNLAGRGFTSLVEEGQQVDVGQSLIEFDADFVAFNARSLLTLMLVVSGEPFTWLTSERGTVDSGQPLLGMNPLGQVSDAQAAIDTLTQPLAGECGETMEVTAQVARAAAAQELRGVCASPGLAFGQVPEVEEWGEGAYVERERLSRALAEAASALQQLRDDAREDSQAQIFMAHQELLKDPGLLNLADTLIGEGNSAGFAWQAATEATATLFINLGNSLLVQRAADLADVSRRVLKVLLETKVAVAPGRVADAVAALGGMDNLKSQQPVALTRVRVELRDVGWMNRRALNVAGVQGVMVLEGGVVHLIVGLQ
jgi:glucose-specific phosphotransferase system IIA component